MDARGAFGMFDKFREEETNLLCSGRMFGFSFVLFGRVSKLSLDEVEVTSQDGTATICLRLVADGLTFRYREPRDFPALSHFPDKYRMSIGVIAELPDRGLVAIREHVMFLEVPRP